MEMTTETSWADVRPAWQEAPSRKLRASDSACASSTRGVGVQFGRYVGYPPEVGEGGQECLDRVTLGRLDSATPQLLREVGLAGIAIRHVADSLGYTEYEPHLGSRGGDLAPLGRAGLLSRALLPLSLGCHAPLQADPPGLSALSSRLLRLAVLSAETT